MSQIASPSQLRMSLLRWALFIIPTIMFLGFLSGQVAGSGNDNPWFSVLIKPEMQPPGFIFGIVWPILYLMIGLAFSMILFAKGAKGRGVAISFFVIQLLLNYFWSPLFFGMHKVTSAFYLILLIFGLSVVTTFLFGKIRKAAAWLMVPYLAWLSFASILNYQIDSLNPDAETLYVSAANTQIGNE